MILKGSFYVVDQRSQRDYYPKKVNSIFDVNYKREPGTSGIKRLCQPIDLQNPQDEDQE